MIGGTHVIRFLYLYELLLRRLVLVGVRVKLSCKLTAYETKAGTEMRKGRTAK